MKSNDTIFTRIHILARAVFQKCCSLTRFASTFLSVVVLLVFLTELILISMGIVDFYFESQRTDFLVSTPNVSSQIAIRPIAILLSSIILSAILLSWITYHVLATSLSCSSSFSRLTRRISRVLCTLPTLILGNAFLFLVPSAVWGSRNESVAVIWISITLIVVSLPTTLTYGFELFSDPALYGVQHARALGVDNTTTVKHLVLARLNTPLRVGVFLAISRTLIEAFVVVDSLSRSTDFRFSVTGSEQVLAILNAAYSTMTVRSNVVLILVLFIISLIANAFSFTISSTSAAR